MGTMAVSQVLSNENSTRWRRGWEAILITLVSSIYLNRTHFFEITTTRLTFYVALYVVIYVASCQRAGARGFAPLLVGSPLHNFASVRISTNPSNSSSSLPRRGSGIT